MSRPVASECGFLVHLLPLGFKEPLELILGNEYWFAKSRAWLGLGLPVSITLIMLIMGSSFLENALSVGLFPVTASMIYSHASLRREY